MSPKERLTEKTNIFLVVEYRPLKMKLEHSLGIILNISSDGFTFEAPDFGYEVGEILEFNLKDENSEMKVPAVGQIVSKNDGWYKCMMKVRFMEIDEDAKKTLFEMISTKKDDFIDSGAPTSHPSEPDEKQEDEKQIKEGSKPQEDKAPGTPDKEKAQVSQKLAHVQNIPEDKTSTEVGDPDSEAQKSPSPRPKEEQKEIKPAEEINKKPRESKPILSKEVKAVTNINPEESRQSLTGAEASPVKVRTERSDAEKTSRDPENKEAQPPVVSIQKKTKIHKDKKNKDKKPVQAKQGVINNYPSIRKKGRTKKRSYLSMSLIAIIVMAVSFSITLGILNYFDLGVDDLVSKQVDSLSKHINNIKMRIFDSNDSQKNYVPPLINTEGKGENDSTGISLKNDRTNKELSANTISGEKNVGDRTTTDTRKDKLVNKDDRMITKKTDTGIQKQKEKNILSNLAIWKYLRSDKVAAKSDNPAEGKSLQSDEKSHQSNNVSNTGDVIKTEAPTINTEKIFGADHSTGKIKRVPKRKAGLTIIDPIIEKPVQNIVIAKEKNTHAAVAKLNNSKKRIRSPDTSGLNEIVYFSKNSDEVSDRYYAKIDNFANILRKYSKSKVKVIGHTDSLGPDIYNMQLSMRRANAVKKLLVQRGFAISRIEVIGQGDASPADTNETESGRNKNRRVEMRIVFSSR